MLLYHPEDQKIINWLIQRRAEAGVVEKLTDKLVEDLRDCRFDEFRKVARFAYDFGSKEDCLRMAEARAAREAELGDKLKLGQVLELLQSLAEELGRADTARFVRQKLEQWGPLERETHARLASRAEAQLRGAAEASSWGARAGRVFSQVKTQALARRYSLLLLAGLLAVFWLRRRPGLWGRLQRLII